MAPSALSLASCLCFSSLLCPSYGTARFISPLTLQRVPLVSLLSVYANASVYVCFPLYLLRIWSVCLNTVKHLHLFSIHLIPGMVFIVCLCVCARACQTISYERRNIGTKSTTCLSISLMLFRFFSGHLLPFFFACLASQPVVALAWVCMIACMCTCKCVCVCLPACLCINMQRKQLAWLMAVPPRVPPRSCPLLYTMLIQLNTASSSSFSSAAAVALLLEASNRSRCLCVCVCMHVCVI